MAPCFRGLGYGMLFTSKMTDVYYSMILAWCVFYLCNGFTSTLPWETCEEEYNTYDCYSQKFQVGVGSLGNSTTHTCSFIANMSQNM